jgi:hypothetical protein
VDTKHPKSSTIGLFATLFAFPLDKNVSTSAREKIVTTSLKLQPPNLVGPKQKTITSSRSPKEESVSIQRRDIL